MSASDDDDGDQKEADELIEWLRSEPKPTAKKRLSIETRHDPRRHFDVTGSNLAYGIVGLFTVVVLISLGVIVVSRDLNRLDAYLRIVIPSLTGFVGAAFGFYFRSRNGSG